MHSKSQTHITNIETFQNIGDIALFSSILAILAPFKHKCARAAFGKNQSVETLHACLNSRSFGAFLLGMPRDRIINNAHTSVAVTLFVQDQLPTSTNGQCKKGA